MINENNFIKDVFDKECVFPKSLLLLSNLITFSLTLCKLKFVNIRG